MKDSKICLALDGMSPKQAQDLAFSLGQHTHAFKLHDLLDAEGIRIFLLLRNAGIKIIWVDYKLHDTRDTVGLRVEALARNGAKIITVHASGGVEMMQAAVAAAANRNCEIWAITVLTSLNDAEIRRIYGKERSRQEIVLEFALMAKEAGTDGVVCSAQEVGMLAKAPQLVGMKFAVPGTRSLGADLGQQKRSGTPAQAVADGATYLVAGSQVTKASEPVEAFKAFAAEIGTFIE